MELAKSTELVVVVDATAVAASVDDAASVGVPNVVVAATDDGKMPPPWMVVIVVPDDIVAVPTAATAETDDAVTVTPLSTVGDTAGIVVVQEIAVAVTVLLTVLSGTRTVSATHGRDVFVNVPGSSEVAAVNARCPTPSPTLDVDDADFVSTPAE
jgi:hypothetical protein